MEEDNSKVDFQEVENLIPSQLREIRLVLTDKYGIAIPRQCDGFIVRCLRLKDGKIEKAIKLIKTFHSTTSDFQEWDAKLLPSCYYDFYYAGAMTPLLKRDSHGRRIFIVRTEMWNPQKMNFDEALAGLWIMAQYANAACVDVQRNGYVTIWDFSNFSLKHAWAVKQWRLITLAKWIQNGVAGRIKAFHAIFHPRVVGVLYAGLKPFLKEKLRRRIIFHDSVESLHRFVDPESLPSYLGGDLPPDGDCTVDTSLIKDILKEDEFFKDMMRKRFPSK